MIVNPCGGTTERHFSLWAFSLLTIAGTLFMLTGIALVLIGIFAPSDHSAFELFAGPGLTVSGGLIAKRHIAGAWLYGIVIVRTVIWSLHEVGLGGSSLLYRLMGPLMMLGMIVVLLPAFYRGCRTKTAAKSTGSPLQPLCTGDFQ